MELVIALFADLVSFGFGALAGLLYPPKSPKWARWQLAGFLAGALSVTALGLGFAWLKTPLALPAIIAGTVFLVSYLVIGNFCRIRHERQSPKE